MDFTGIFRKVINANSDHIQMWGMWRVTNLDVVENNSYQDFCQSKWKTARWLFQFFNPTCDKFGTDLVLEKTIIIQITNFVSDPDPIYC